MRELVTHFLGESLSRGVADAGVIRGEASRQITLRRNDAERVVARDSILTFADLMEQAEAAGIVVEDPGRASGPSGASWGRSTARPSCPTRRSQRAPRAAAGERRPGAASASARASGSCPRARPSARSSGPS